MTVNLTDTRVLSDGSTYVQRCNLMAALQDRDLRHEYTRMQDRQGGVPKSNINFDFGNQEPEKRRTGRRSHNMPSGKNSCPFDVSQVSNMRSESSRYGDFMGGGGGGAAAKAESFLPIIHVQRGRSNQQTEVDQSRATGKRKIQNCRLPEV